MEGEVIKQLIEFTGKAFVVGASAEAARRTMNKICTSVERKLKSKKVKVEDLKPENINPRILNRVMQEGLFSDDELGVEYISGILASAISKDGKDDSAMPYLSIINSLSARQLRLLFLIYQAINKKLVADDTKKELDVGSGLELGKEVFFFYVLEFQEECGYKDLYIQSEIDILYAHGLLQNYNLDNYMTTKKFNVYYLKFTPSILGIRLYAMIFGRLKEWRTFNSVCFSDEEKHYDSIITPLELVGDSLKYFDTNSQKCLDVYLQLEINKNNRHD